MRASKSGYQMAHFDEKKMTTELKRKSEPNEYLPYYGKYITLVPEGEIAEILVQQVYVTVALLRGLSEEQGMYRYAEGKWTIKEVVGHIIDAERVFAYRALRFGRNDAKELQGFDQDPYIQFGNFNNCKLSELIDEFECVRHSTVYLLRHLSDEAWTRRGIASGGEVSVRAIAYIIAGHELHHFNIIRERYL